MARLCVIPARGGSKRIPRKNIRPFLGKPIIAYSIEVALASRLFDEVMVSTDDEEITEIAKSFGAVVPFKRSQKTSGDYSTTIDVLEEVMNSYSPRLFQEVCCIYATAPFVTATLLQKAYAEFSENEFDSVFPVIPYDSPIQRAFYRKPDSSKVDMINPATINERTQDLDPAYYDAGMFYWFRPDLVFPKRRMYTNNSGSIILTPLQGHDIDTEEDWALAELKFSLLK